MGTVRALPELNLNVLIEEGYHPTAYVLASKRSVKAMDMIAGYRADDVAKYKAFDKAIIDFANNPKNKQSQKSYDAKKKAYEMLKNALPSYKGAGLYFCGSSMTGCGGDSCDVDFCWAIPADSIIEKDVLYPMEKQGRFDPHMKMREALETLEQKLPCIRNTSIISARVSIMKFDIVVNGLILPCDININNTAGIYNTFMLAHYVAIDERFSILARVLKAWGKKAGIINSTIGYLNSYTMTLMVLHYLQCGVSPPILPNLVALHYDLFGGNLNLETLAKSYPEDRPLSIEMKERNTTPIGDLLIGFLRYYGMFNYEHDGIILRRGCVAPKPTEKDVFFLEEVYDRYTVPKNLDMEKLDKIKMIFLDAYMLVLNGPNFEDLMDDKKYFLDENY